MSSQSAQSNESGQPTKRLQRINLTMPKRADQNITPPQRTPPARPQRIKLTAPRDPRTPSEIELDIPFPLPELFSDLPGGRLRRTFDIPIPKKAKKITFKPENPNPFAKKAARDCVKISPAAVFISKGAESFLDDDWALLSKEEIEGEEDDSVASRLHEYQWGQWHGTEDSDDENYPAELPTWVDGPPCLFTQSEPWNPACDCGESHEGSLPRGFEYFSPETCFFEDVFLSDRSSISSDGADAEELKGKGEGVMAAAIAGKKRKFDVLGDVDDWALSQGKPVVSLLVVTESQRQKSAREISASRKRS